MLSSDKKPRVEGGQLFFSIFRLITRKRNEWAILVRRPVRYSQLAPHKTKKSQPASSHLHHPKSFFHVGVGFSFASRSADGFLGKPDDWTVLATPLGRRPFLNSFTNGRDKENGVFLIINLKPSDSTWYLFDQWSIGFCH